MHLSMISPPPPPWGITAVAFPPPFPHPHPWEIFFTVNGAVLIEAMPHIKEVEL